MTEPTGPSCCPPSPTSTRVLIRSATKMDAEAIAAAKRLKVIARAGVGLDNVDVQSATEAGVMVVNAPTSNITSAAELAVGLLLAAARNIAPANAALKAGAWKRCQYTGVELLDKTVGVVGLGRIGALVAERLQAFGMKVIAYDPYVSPARAGQLGARLVGLDELLAAVRLHHRAPAQDPRDPRPHRRGSAAQGQAVGAHHQRRPRRHRRRGRPGRGDRRGPGRRRRHRRVRQRADHRVARCSSYESVVVTPHLGASTDEAQEKAGIAVAKSVRLALGGELVPDAVNVAAASSPRRCARASPLVEKLGRVFTAVAGSVPVAARRRGARRDHRARRQGARSSPRSRACSPTSSRSRDLRQRARCSPSSAAVDVRLSPTPTSQRLPQRHHPAWRPCRRQ